MDQVKFVEDSITSDLLKGVSHKIYLVHSWIPWPICKYEMTMNEKLLELTLTETIADK